MRKTAPPTDRHQKSRISALKRSLSAAITGRSNAYANSDNLEQLRLFGRKLGAEAALHLSDLWPQRHVEPERYCVDVVDLFCGCGGMSAGFQAFNAIVPTYRLLAAVDIDRDSRKSYARNLGVEPLDLDVASLARSQPQLHEVLSSAGRSVRNPLVLIGCSPCQGFSSHRNARGREDLRNSLFLDTITIAEATLPDVLIIENVPELLTGDYWQYVEIARERLERSGYFVHVSYHNMAGFGVPQERFRALILAMRHSFAPITSLLNHTEFRTVRDAIGHLTALPAGGKDLQDELHYCVKHKLSTVETIRQVPLNGGSLPPGVGPACLQRAHTRTGKRVYEDVYGRLFWDKPAITITSHARNPASGRFVHPEQDRGLSVREAALLQSFPKSYSVHGSLDSSFRQIGNAVPPSFSAFLAAHVATELACGGLLEMPFDRGVQASLGASFSRIIPSLKLRNKSATTDRKTCPAR